MMSMDLTGAQIMAILNEGFNGSTNEGPATGSTQNANNKVLQVSASTTRGTSPTRRWSALRPWSA